MGTMNMTAAEQDSFRSPSFQAMPNFSKHIAMSGFEPHQTACVLIDGANIYNSAQTLGFQVDFNRLKNLIQSVCKPKAFYYFTAVREFRNGSKSLQPQIDFLEYNGFRVIQKQAKGLSEHEGGTGVKGNMDIEMTIYALEMCKHVEHVILMTGDGDFRFLVETLQNRGQLVTVISTKTPRPPPLADELRRQADYVIDLNDIRSNIERPRDRTPKAS